MLRRRTAKLRLVAPLRAPARAKGQARSSLVRQGRSSAASQVLPLEVLPPRRLSRVRRLETSARRSRPPAATNSQSAEARQAHPERATPATCRAAGADRGYGLVPDLSTELHK